jgi:hypothetical protein
VYLKFYNPSEHLAIDEVTELFKGMVAFKQCIRKKHEHFVNKIYKLCVTIDSRPFCTGTTENKIDLLTYIVF